MKLTDTVRDAAFVGIGFAVLGFQKAQVRRQELTQQLQEQRSQIETQVAGLAQQVEGQLAPLRSQIEARLSEVEARLPAPAQDWVKQAREAIETQQKAVQGRFRYNGAAA